MDLKVKEITNFLDNEKEKTKIVFCQDNIEKEIIFEGNGRLKTAVTES